ncbi:MAG: molybdenum cofactor guanylyltransferase [Jatrophihabitantaceae bacterium]
MFDAIVLAGGRAARLDGADKAGLRVGGRPMLERVLDAVADAAHVAVVGPRRASPRPVSWRREDPPGGGPVAAIGGGVEGVCLGEVVVLAADLPWIAPAVPALLDALAAGPGNVAVLVDASGRRNYLAAAWRTAALRTALAATGDMSGAPVRGLLAAADTIDVADPDGWGRDCDTWDDVAEAQRRAEQRSAL